MRVFISILVVTAMVVAFSSFSPQGTGTKIPKLKTYFACQQSGKMVMTAEQFLQYINQPFCAKDEQDSLYRVTRFQMIYAETGLYQDSAGLPIVHTDYQYAYMQGDTISQIWKNIFADHAYRGDTIKIREVRAIGADKKPYHSSDIDLILQ